MHRHFSSRVALILNTNFYMYIRVVVVCFIYGITHQVSERWHTCRCSNALPYLLSLAFHVRARSALRSLLVVGGFAAEGEGPAKLHTFYKRTTASSPAGAVGASAPSGSAVEGHPPAGAAVAERHGWEIMEPVSIVAHHKDDKDANWTPDAFDYAVDD